MTITCLLLKCIFRKKRGAAGLCEALRDQFVRFGVASDIPTDGGPEFVSQTVKELFQNWGVKHIVLVKATKKLLRDIVKSYGFLDTNKFVRAILTKRNTPDSRQL